MRAPSSRWTSWKWTVFDSVAVCSFTGTVISPKAIVPFQIDRAMTLLYPGGPGASRWQAARRAGAHRGGRPPGGRGLSPPPPACLPGRRTRASRIPARRAGCDALPMLPARPTEPLTTASDARLELQRLLAQRLDAADAGLDVNDLYMTALETDIEVSRAAFVGLAVTEIASLRAELSGPQGG